MSHKLKVAVHIKTAGELPRYETAGASGLDVRADIGAPICLAEGVTLHIPTGISLEMPYDLECQVRPRSGLAKKGVFAILGTVDSDYRGEIGVLLTNVSNSAYYIQPGDRIAQLVFAPVVRVNLVQVDTLTETSRGDRGFGSTGRT